MDYDSSRSEVWLQTNGINEMQFWNARRHHQSNLHYISAYHIQLSRKIFSITNTLEKFVCEKILVKWVRNEFNQQITLIYFSKKMAKIVSSQNGTKFHQI